MSQTSCEGVEEWRNLTDTSKLCTKCSSIPHLFPPHLYSPLSFSPFSPSSLLLSLPSPPPPPLSFSPSSPVFSHPSPPLPPLSSSPTPLLSPAGAHSLPAGCTGRLESEGYGGMDQCFQSCHLKEQAGSESSTRELIMPWGVHRGQFSI